MYFRKGKGKLFAPLPLRHSKERPPEGALSA